MLALLCANLHPIHGQIITDEGVWEESWRRQFGWPRMVYVEFGTDARTPMVFWDGEGLLYNGRVMAGAAAAAFGVFLVLVRLTEKRPVIRDS